jgi:hypothetical protein
MGKGKSRSYEGWTALNVKQILDLECMLCGVQLSSAVMKQCTYLHQSPVCTNGVFAVLVRNKLLRYDV